MSEPMFEDAFRRATVGLAIIGPDGRYLRVNPSFCRFLRRSEEELLGTTFDSVAHPSDRDEALVRHRRLMDGETEDEQFEKRFVCGDGTIVWGNVWTSAVRSEEGEPMYRFAQTVDVTERRRSDETLRQTETTLQLLFESASEGILLVDGEARIISANRRIAEMFGYEPDELRNCPVEMLVPERFRRVLHREREGYIARRERRPMGRGLELSGLRRDGSEFPIEVGLGSARTQSGTSLTTCVVTDITERSRAQELLAHQATHDALTGLANRSLFLDRLQGALARSNRSGSVAVLFLDLDRFKVVNDSLGHGAGDRVLVETGSRLTSLLREGDTVARFGGDEFAMLCEAVGDPKEAVAVAQRILDALKASIAVSGEEVVVSPSIGITLSAPGVTAEALVRDADAAMYRAKDRGRARYELFHPDMRKHAMGRFTTESGLRRALENGELRVHYQPMIDLADDRVVGAEALARWSDGDVAIPPDVFIPLAEETGLIVDLGAQVLRQACLDAAPWSQNESFVLSANLSMHQLDDGLVESVLQALADAGCHPSILCLELTESAIMSDAEGSISVMKRLKESGVSMAIDDFGTGYSSLSHLGRLPVDLLKVDRSFVSGIGVSTDDSSIVTAVIELAHALGITAVAEGVESAKQRDLLRALGCDLAQGYHFGPPMDAATFTRFLAANRAERRRRGD